MRLSKANRAGNGLAGFQAHPGIIGLRLPIVDRAPDPLLYGSRASARRHARPAPGRGHARHAARCPSSPLSSARSAGPVGTRPRAWGQVDLPPRADVRAHWPRGAPASPACWKGEDVLNTVKALAGPGLPHRQGRGGVGGAWAAALGGLPQPAATLDFGNSGTGARLMMGVVAGNDIPRAWSGTPRCQRRPMGRVLEPLMRMGAGGGGRRKRDVAADAARHARSVAHRVSAAGAVGPDQVGRSARRAARGRAKPA